MKAWPRRTLPLWPKLDGKLIAAALGSIADRLVGFSRPQIFPNPHISKRAKSRVVKCSGALDIGNT
jgi:hypothetical protein